MVAQVSAPSKGIDYVVEKLFPHLGKLFGMPDHVACELSCTIGTIKNRATGHFASVDTWTEFKSHDHFTDSNVEIAMCKFENSSFHFTKIGHVDKGPAGLHKENKKHGKHEPPRMIGKCRKAIKLIARGLGNIANITLVDETASDFQK